MPSARFLPPFERLEHDGSRGFTAANGIGTQSNATPVNDEQPGTAESRRPLSPHGCARQAKEFRLDLNLGPDRLQLSLGGKLSILSARPLAVVLASLNVLPPPVDVHCGEVIAADADGLRPLFEIARYRRQRGLASLEVVEFSDAVRELLSSLRVPCTPRPDIAAWDASQSRLHPASHRSLRRLRLVTKPAEPCRDS